MQETKNKRKTLFFLVRFRGLDMLFSQIEIYNCGLRTAMNYMKDYLQTGNKDSLQIYNKVFNNL